MDKTVLKIFIDYLVVHRHALFFLFSVERALYYYVIVSTIWLTPNRRIEKPIELSPPSLSLKKYNAYQQLLFHTAYYYDKKKSLF